MSESERKRDIKGDAIFRHSEKNSIEENSNLIPMNSTMMLFLTTMLIVSSLTNAKTVFSDHYETTGENASAFLHHTSDDHPSGDFDKRELGRNCIPCKFGINPCCEPNICLKKTFWPDECMEIKQAKPHKQPHFQ